MAQDALFLLHYSDKHFNAGDERIERARSNFGPTHATCVANSHFEAELISKLLLTATHLRKPFSSRGVRTHLRVRYTYVLFTQWRSLLD